METPKDYLDSVFTDLDGVAPCYFGHKEVLRTRVPPAFVFVPTTIDTSKADRVQDDPRIFLRDNHMFSVVLYAKSYEDLIAMRAALQTSVRKIDDGQRFELRNTTFENDLDGNFGWLMTCELACVTYTPEVTYNEGPFDKANQPNDHVSEDDQRGVEIEDDALNDSAVLPPVASDEWINGSEL